MSDSQRPVYLVGCGGSLPRYRYTNRELAPWFNCDEATADRYAEKTGIHARHSVVDLEGGRRQKVLNESLAHEAAAIALESAGIDALELDCVITAVSTFDYFLPSIGSRLLKLLGIPEAMTFDLYGGCAQFLMGVAMATNFVRTGMAHTVLVTASESFTSFARQFRYPVDAFIFGDAGAAWVITSLPREGTFPMFEIHETATGTISEIDGVSAEVIMQPITGFKEEFDLFHHDETIDDRMRDLHPDTRHQYRWHHNGKLVLQCAKYGLLEGFRRVTKDDLDGGGLVLPHQATRPTLRAAAADLPEGWTALENLRDRGNVSTACVPLAMYEHLDACVAADTIVATSVGVGFSFAGARMTRVQ